MPERFVRAGSRRIEEAGADSRADCSIHCACVTTWPVAGGPAVALKEIWDADPLEHPAELEQLEQALERDDVPVWVELSLVGAREGVRWFEPAIEPWDPVERPRVSWDGVAQVLDVLRLDSPDDPRPTVTAKALAVLPLVYTLGVRRTRAELGSAGAGVEVFPAMGFQSPAAGHVGPTWMYRLNVVIVGDFVFTLRLPDRQWPEKSSTKPGTPAPTLVVRERFMPAAGQPTPIQLAEGIAIHQAATCGAIVARGRNWLQTIERSFVDASGPADDPLSTDDGQGEADSDPMLNATALRRKFHDLFRLGIRAEELERHLSRTCSSFDEPDASSVATAVKARYVDALGTVRSFQLDLRQRTDGIAGMIASQQFAIAEAQQTATTRFQRRATIVGSAVLIPALVAGVFGANVDVPGHDRVRGLVAMLCFMVALGVGTWWAIISLDHPEARVTKEWQTNFAHVYAGFFVAFVSLAFGIVTVTPAVESTLPGEDAAWALLGVLLIAGGLGLSVWCWLNGPLRSSWWKLHRTAAKLTKAGRFLAPALTLVGAVLASAFLL